METTWKHSGKVSVAALIGRMDAVSAQILEQQSGQLAGKVDRLVFDLSQLEYISSVGLRSVLSVAKIIQEHGGVLCLCGLHGLVKDILECANFTTLLPVYKTAKEAVAGRD